MRNAAYVAVGVFFGVLIGANADRTSAAPSGNPTDGWTIHSDVNDHFPHHPASFAHHWCKRISVRLVECQLYDSDAPNAKLVGVEPIVSDETFRSFPPAEQRSWHWHKTSKATIVIPGASAQKNQTVNRRRGTTHGKTILLWDPLDSVDPVGPPRIIPH
ncbi:MAG: DUF1264 domain-containing protein [Candidatus Baltobacteraceae bacterium]